MKKKLLSAILTASMVIGLISANAVLIDYEDIEEQENNIYFEDMEIVEPEEIEPIQTETVIAEETANITDFYINEISSPLATNINEIQTFSTYATIPIKELNVIPNVQVLDVKNMDFLTGRYQFNYTGSSNKWHENGNFIGSAIDTGYSHLPELASYESGTYKNSSGAYLDGSYNQGGNIYKAYLTIEYSGGFSYKDYPITLIYGGENGIPKNGIRTKMQTILTQNLIGTNDFGWVDITNYIKENGYGWYYCCNTTTI